MSSARWNLCRLPTLSAHRTRRARLLLSRLLDKHPPPSAATTPFLTRFHRQARVAAQLAELHLGHRQLEQGERDSVREQHGHSEATLRRGWAPPLQPLLTHVDYSPRAISPSPARPRTNALTPPRAPRPSSHAPSLTLWRAAREPPHAHAAFSVRGADVM
eukprot:3029593-Pleurochrysis_carterae.AAC.1